LAKTGVAESRPPFAHSGLDLPGVFGHIKGI
jgi:hypothetical protein